MQTISKSKDFDRVFRRGSSVSSAELVMYALRRSQSSKIGLRVAFCVSKKLGGAVQRNRMRRRMREVYRLNLEKLETRCDVILLARQSVKKVPFLTLQRKFLELSGKLGILRKEKTPAAPAVS